MSVVLYDIRDGVAVVTLNRPEARNALSGEVLSELRSTMVRADEDPAVAVVVLTGADPAFCAGLDLKELGSGRRSLGAESTFSAPWPPLSKLVIGAVNGVAVTGGLELALNCDFLVASDRAKFGDTHARVGIMPGWGLSVLLPRRVGLARAVEMSMTGNFMGAEEALARGLVNHVVAHEALMAFTMRLAADAAGNDLDTARSLLASYKRIAGAAGGDEGLALEAKAARAWQGRSFDPAEVERRRAAIVERGRSQ